MIEDLVAANRILVNEGVLDAYGHVSLRHPANSGRYLMGRNLAPALVTAADIVEYDLDSQPVGAPASFAHFFERFIHGEIYRARPDVNAGGHSFQRDRAALAPALSHVLLPLSRRAGVRDP